MNPESSTKGKDPYREVTRIEMPVGIWEEENFVPTLQMLPARSDSIFEDPSVMEAIGAADDPTRFRVDLQFLDMVVLEVHY